MRIPLLLGLAFILLPLPSVSGQEGATEEMPSVRIPDPADDAREIGPTTNQSDDGRHPQADILEVWVGNETLETVDFGIRFKQLPNLDATTTVPLAGLAGITLSPGFTIRWSLGLANFSIQAGGEMTNCGGSSFALHRQYPRGTSVSCGFFEPKVDEATASMTFTLPRERLLNHTDAPFGPGADMTRIYATASEVVTPGPAGTTVRDRAPDEGFGPAYHSTLAGEAGSGTFSMTATEPVRVSNGESTTLVYPVDITNLGDTTRIVHLATKTNMSEWQIRTPSRLQLEPKATITFPVILSMGFSHDHGGLTTFEVRAEDAADPKEWAKVRLGVFWLDTPQPAGHHDKLWLHSGGGSGYGFGVVGRCQTLGLWFNPLETELEGRASEADAAGCDFTLGQTDTATNYAEGQMFEWHINLEPPLAIGLDFDLTRIGTFTTAVKSKTASSAATLRMELLYCNTALQPAPEDRDVTFERCSGKWLVLADASQTRAMGANAQVAFDLQFSPTPEADFLPFVRDSNLLLLVSLHSVEPLTPPGQSTQEIGPLLVVKGSELALPLVEYHDPIDQAFQNIGTLELSARDAFEKPINPGRRSLFTFDLTNRGNIAQEIDLQIEGHNREWARVIGPERFGLAPGEKTNFTILSEAPGDAQTGERAELFVVAQSETDPNVVAIARLRSTLVDPAVQDVPDEDPSRVAADAGTTPGLVGAFPLAAALVGAWVYGRRRP